MQQRAAGFQFAHRPIKTLPNMVNIFKTKIPKIFKITFLLSFLLAEFFGFGFLSGAVAAGCNYTINFQEANNYTTASPGQTLNFNVSVTEKGDQTCATSLNIDLTQSISAGNYSVQNNRSFGSDGRATAQFAYKVPDGYNKITIQAKAEVSGTIVTSSTPWVINISGASNFGSQSKITLDPQKQLYSDGDNIAIYANIDPSLYSQIKARGISSIYLNLLINNQGAFTGTTVVLDDLIQDGGAGYGQFIINQKNGFKDGTNSLTIELWQAGSQVKLGSVSTNVQVQGLSVGASGAPTIVFSPDRAAGANLTVTLQNPPSNFGSMVVNVNGRANSVPKTQTSYSLPISETQGFNMTGNNTVSVALLDTQGNTISSSPAGSPLVFQVGQAAGPGSGGAPTGPSTQGNSVSTLYNPLPEEDIVHAFLLVAQGLLGILGVLAVTFIIVGGFQMVIAAGNEEMLVKAKKTILWAVLGLLIALLSFSIIAIVQDILKTNIKPASSSFNIQPSNKA
jgi:hypothetical protein